MLVYIIQTGNELENRYATLDKEVAKQIIKNEILDSDYDEIWDGQDIETFAQDMVDGNTENHYCDEFEDVLIWCNVLELQEK